MKRGRATVAVLIVAVLLTGGSIAAWSVLREAPVVTSSGAPEVIAVGPTRHTGPQGRVGQFVVKCDYSHSGPDDPIVHPGHSGRSHRHDFYGAVGSDGSSTAARLTRQRTTCDKSPDTAAYWHPTLFDRGVAVRPAALHAYYRAAPGVEPKDVEPFPFGLALIAGHATATLPSPTEAAGWVCGASTRLLVRPPACPANAPLHLVLTFQDCWDGTRLDSSDHRSHVAYSKNGECPATRPVHLPQLTVSVKFPISGTGHELRLASGSVYSAHGDFLNAWDPAGLEREIAGCIRRNVVCDLASNREEEAPFQHD